MRFLRIRESQREYFARWVDDATVALWSAAPWDGGKETDRLIRYRADALLPPTTPSKIVAVGRNYVEHAQELAQQVPEEPLLFMKPPSALLAPGRTIELPPMSSRVEHEAELGVVIGKRIRNIDASEALAAVFGYTCINDVTARDLQRKDVQFTRSKSFDTFCPCGPWIETELDPSNLALSLRVNEEQRQLARTSEMVFSVPTLIAFISRVMTLLPGDLISTGTPAGVGPLVPGDKVDVEIEGIGILHNEVAAS